MCGGGRTVCVCVGRFSVCVCVGGGGGGQIVKKISREVSSSNV